MSAGTCHQATPNRPDLTRVTGMAQLVGHLFFRAMTSETMHAVDTTGAPQLPEKILGKTQPCLQAAAFGAAGKANAVAILNICNQSTNATIVAATNALQQVVSSALAQIVSYDLADHGGKASLPKNPKDVPWPAPLTSQRVPLATTPLVTLPPLSFSMVEMG
jgi:hypothetical protein